ncbi:uncharacterized protein LOC131636777 [Vicia villosa]|uniref:uncharacterized protein LOC131636777 n=1 Tax=Vicia villosa TaxID=3911 RepID=UPI00273B8883|nr:uncharacterized protein LOC131636777 [Vicia villosa]
MWVRKGVISIIDLSNDYYLVAFSHEDDKKAAMENGPWFIYDHYLTVKNWRPNFQPEIDTIDEVAVWVRIAGLPIEYYDPRALKVFGDRIGRTIKVDKTTIKQERGKYARVCVAVDLSKPLLAMFSVKGSNYKVEYEGLHLLCMVCGKYGHYKESCPLKAKEDTRIQEGDGGKGKESSTVNRDLGRSNSKDDEGPWRVVQKQKRGRKMVEGRKSYAPTQINDDSKLRGSRFLALENEDLVIDGKEMDVNGEDLNQKEINDNSNLTFMVHGRESAEINTGDVEEADVGELRSKTNNFQKEDLVESLTGLGINGKVTVGPTDGSQKSMTGKGGRRQEKVNKNTALATRGKIQAKEKGSSISRTGVEGMFGNVQPGELNVVEKCDMYNLIGRENNTGVGQKRCMVVSHDVSRDMHVMGEPSGSHAIDSSHADVVSNFAIDKPPDIDENSRKENLFFYGTSIEHIDTGSRGNITASCDAMGVEGTLEEVCETPLMS